MAEPSLSKSVSKHDDFWSRNGGGIPVEALFGDKGGAGEIGRRIAAADVNGDGHLSKLEFRNAIEGAVNDSQSAKQMRKGLLVLLGFSCLLLCCIFGLILAVTELSKETNVKGAVMTVKGTGEPVKVASTDFAPAAADLGGGASAGQGALVNSADNSLVSTSEALVYAPLSTSRPDDDFAQLKTVTLSSGEASMLLRVEGFVRLSESSSNSSAAGDVLIVTPFGNMKVIGSDFQFTDESSNAIIMDAGFNVTDMGKGMLQSTSVLGGFNNVPEEYRR